MWEFVLNKSFFLFISGYYQPAGPLITSHLVSGPQNLTKQPLSSPLDSESLQQSQQSSSVEGNLKLILMKQGNVANYDFFLKTNLLENSKLTRTCKKK